MKKILFIVLLVVASLTVNAQVNFMGIPVDGTATEMIQQLKKKGFQEMTEKFEMEGKQLPILKGTFNGTQVHLFVCTNHKKVYRIYLAETKTHDESSIILEFNTWFSQFYNNKKYVLIGGEKISLNEDISYEMTCHNKLYDAYFYQIVSNSMIEDNTVWFRIAEYYGEYYLTIYYDNEINKANGEDL